MVGTKKSTLTKLVDYYNIRIMPHGGPVLFPITLVTLGWIAAIAHDGCDFARVTGPAAELLTGSPAVPYVDCGMAAYRVPGFYPAANSWRVAYSEECLSYAYIEVLADRPWVSAEWLNFLSIIVGGGTTMFLWSATCLTLRPNSWRAAGVGLMLSWICQVCSLVWFYTDLCSTSSRNIQEFAAGRQNSNNSENGETSSCYLYFGSKCVITSSCLWFLASIYMLFGKYPMPVPKLVAQDDTESVATPPPGRIIAPGGYQPISGGKGGIGARSSRNLASSVRSSVDGGSLRNLQSSRNIQQERASFVSKLSHPGDG